MNRVWGGPNFIGIYAPGHNSVEKMAAIAKAAVSDFGPFLND